MAELFYKDERDSDFFRVCESVRGELGQSTPIPEIVSRAILKPACSFFLHPREYYRIIKASGKNLPMNEIKRELHLEILRRYYEIHAANPELKIYEAARMLVEQEAPRFYISKRRAVDLYYKLLKNNPRL